MAKLIAILVGALMAVDGAGYGVYSYTNVPEEAIDPADCPIAKMKCCDDPTSCPIRSAEDQSAAGMAVAGPAALFTPKPVKVAAFNCCEEPASGQAAQTAAAK